MRRRNAIWGASLLLVAAVLAGCADAQKLAIARVLDARDAAITHRDTAAFSSLLIDDYNDRGRTKITLVAELMDLFDRFDATEMESFDRIIRLIDDTHAQCEQSYRLRVRSGEDWREIIQREQLYLKKTPTGWKISGGL